MTRFIFGDLGHDSAVGAQTAPRENPVIGSATHCVLSSITNWSDAIMDDIRFGSAEISKILARLGHDRLDDLPFGAILLDATGKILHYNTTESAISGRNAEDVIGKNFFVDIAPCTNVPGFKEKFESGVRSGSLNTLFEMVFDHDMTPTRVRVHMKNAEDGNMWIFTKRLS